jgi:dGTP triphosphohydrolase
MKELGIAVTPEIEKQFAGDWVTQSEVDRKARKTEKLEDEKKQLEAQYSELEKKVQKLEEDAGDTVALNAKIAELNATIETERKERAAKEETERISAQVAEFFGDKHFVNDITADSIKNTLVAELQKDTAKGRSISDIFDSIVKDDKGEYKPNILISEKDIEAQKNRSQRIGNTIGGQQGGQKPSIAELMKQKNQNPDMDITPYLKQ